MTNQRHHLRLVKSPAPEPGGITVAPHSSPPFPVQALILEEDTWFAISSSPEIREPRTHPIRVMTEAWEAEPAPPGSVHIRDGYPFRILAIVHDLSLDPTWRAEWIELALRRSLRAARQQGAQAIGVEPLGAVHGRFPVADFDALLERVVEEDLAPPLDLWRIEPRR